MFNEDLLFCGYMYAITSLDMSRLVSEQTIFRAWVILKLARRAEGEISPQNRHPDVLSFL